MKATELPRKHDADTEKLFAIEIGDVVAIEPHPDETVEAALKRWRQRLARRSEDGRSYRSRINGDRIEIQRTEFGKNRQAADLWQMKAGSYLLLKSHPAPKDVKKAQGMADYANKRVRDQPVQSGKSPSGNWHAIKDQTGRLLIVCIEDVNGAIAEGIDSTFVRVDAKLLTPWGGEWP